MSDSKINTLGRLNEALFAELDRLEQVDPSNADELRLEIDRALERRLRAVDGRPWAQDSKFEDGRNE